MLTKDLPVIDDAAETVYHISLDDRIREQCEAREDFYRRQRTTERLMEQQKSALEKKQGQIEEQRGQIEEQQGQIEEQKSQIEKLKQLLRTNGIDPEQV